MDFFYNKYSDFVDLDPRVHRPPQYGYAVSARQQYWRHRCMLSRELVKGRSLLDLGCCVGYSGGWGLNFGLSKYSGVDIDSSSISAAGPIFQRYFPSAAVELECGDVEDYVYNISSSAAGGVWDIVLLSGIIYGLRDPIKFLQHIALVLTPAVLIVESVHLSLPAPFNSIDHAHLPLAVLTDEQQINRGTSTHLMNVLTLSAGFISKLLKQSGYVLSSRSLRRHSVYSRSTGWGRYILEFTSTSRSSSSRTIGLGQTLGIANWGRKTNGI